MLRTLGIVALFGVATGFVLSASCLFTVVDTAGAVSFFAALGETSPVLLALCTVPTGVPLAGIVLVGLLLALLSS